MRLFSIVLVLRYFLISEWELLRGFFVHCADGALFRAPGFLMEFCVWRFCLQILFFRTRVEFCLSNFSCTMISVLAVAFLCIQPKSALKNTTRSRERERECATKDEISYCLPPTFEWKLCEKVSSCVAGALFCRTTCIDILYRRTANRLRQRFIESSVKCSLLERKSLLNLHLECGKVGADFPSKVGPI